MELRSRSWRRCFTHGLTRAGLLAEVSIVNGAKIFEIESKLVNSAFERNCRYRDDAAWRPSTDKFEPRGGVRLVVSFEPTHRKAKYARQPSQRPSTAATGGMAEGTTKTALIYGDQGPEAA